MFILFKNRNVKHDKLWFYLRALTISLLGAVIYWNLIILVKARVCVLSVLVPLVFSHIVETNASCRWTENTALPVGVNISVNVVWQATYFSTEQPCCSIWGLSALLKGTSRTHIYPNCQWVQHLCPKNSYSYSWASLCHALSIRLNVMSPMITYSCCTLTAMSLFNSLFSCFFNPKMMNLRPMRTLQIN